MDARHFDRLARRLGALSSRRTVLGGVLAGLLLPLEAAARGKNHQHRKRKDRDKHKGKGKGKARDKDKKRTNAQAEVCWRAGACSPKKGANVSQCDLAGYAPTATLNCTGCNISRANLRGANLTGANLTKANLSGACLVDATLSGATITNSTNLYNAIFCNTTMPDGSVNNSGCGAGTACCPTCLASGAPCGVGIGACCGGTCGGGTPGIPGICGCTPTTCQAQGTNCGQIPDGCGGVRSCGTCTVPQTCGGGTPGTANVCGCTTATCQSLNTCGPDVPDGCGGLLQCGGCAGNQLCQNSTCQSCDVCASGCQFSSVQAAIDAAPGDTDTIYICPGTYSRPAPHLSVATIPWSLKLVGAGTGPDGTILDAGRIPTSSVVYIYGNSIFGVELRDLTVTGGNSPVGAGIHVSFDTKVMLTRVLVTGNRGIAGSGIYNGGALTLNATTVEINPGGSNVFNVGTITIDAASSIDGVCEGCP